jgi:Fe(3+) dicitrate transport protein
MIGKALALPVILDLTARYTFARATFDDGLYAGKFVPYAPLHAFNANVDLEHVIGAHGIGGQIAYGHVSEQFSDSANTLLANSTGEFGVIPAYDLLDATAHYRNKPTNLTVKLTVKNALDNVHIAGRRPQGIDVQGFRQIFLGLRWDYEKPPPPPTQ